MATTRATTKAKPGAPAVVNRLAGRMRTIPPNKESQRQFATLLKQSRTFELLMQSWMTTQGVPRPETIATFADFARVYKREVWVFACVNRIALSAAGVPVKACRRKRDGTLEPAPDSPLQALLDGVNPHEGTASFIEKLTANLELMGNAYIEKVRKTPTGPPVELYALRPDLMKIVPDPKQYIKGFLYSVNARTIAFEAPDVVHLKTHNPTDDYYGLSTLEAAALAVEVDQYAIGYNRNFFRNHAMPAGILQTPQGVKQEDLTRVQEQFDKLYRGVKNAHRAGFLSGEWKWLDIGLKQRDAQFIDGRKMNREEILAAFGVPPVMVGIFEFANYANSKEQQAIFWELTMLPRLTRLADQLTEQLAADFGPEWAIRFDTSDIEALKEDEESRVTRIRGLVQDGLITRNEGRVMLNLEERDEPEMDQIFVPFTVAPIGQPARTPPGLEDEAGKAARERAATLKGRRWAEFQREADLLEKPLAAGIKSLFVRQREEVVRRLHDAMLNGAIRLSSNGALVVKQRVTLEEILFDLATAEAELEVLGRRHFALAAQRRGQAMLATLGTDLAFKLDDPEVLAFLTEQVFKFKTGINATTQEEIRQALLAGERAGESVTQIAARINALFESANEVRALRIARTEILGAMNFGQLEGMAQSGIVSGKQWLSARDGQVRESHAALDLETDPAAGGRPVGLMSPFSNGLMYPGDQHGRPEEVVNCRCVVLEVLTR